MSAHFWKQPASNSGLNQFNGVRFEQRRSSHSDVLFSMIGLISIGKPDYEAIELFRPKAEFFNLALGLSGCPSAVTLRQRIDLLGHSVEPILAEESAQLVKTNAPALTPIQTQLRAVSAAGYRCKPI